MKLRLHRPATIALSALLIASAALVGVGSAAHAATNTPWEPDAKAVGSLTFYNAAGTQVTSGVVSDAPFATYALASHPGRLANAGTGAVADTKATLYGAVPAAGTAPSGWSNELLSGSTTYPNASAPGALGTTTLPLAKIASDDTTLAQLVNDLPNTGTGAYAGIYQLRVKTSGVGQVSDGSYDTAIIKITGTGSTATWAQIATDTETTVTASPSGSAPEGHEVDVTATVSPARADGTVQFFDGATAIGSPVAVGSDGTATTSTSALSVGAHTLSAQYVPASTVTFNGSTSAGVAYTVGAPAVATTTTLALSPSGAVWHGTSVRFTATVSPSAAAGTVQFREGTVVLKSVAVSGGTASWTTNALTNRTHTYNARFVPTSTVAYVGSTSAAKTLIVKIRTTSTKLTVSKKSIKKGKTLTLKATVTPTTAAGYLVFYDGTKKLATVKASAGRASYSTKKLKKGKHKLSAKYVPANTLNTKASASAKVTVTVKK